MRTVRDSQCSLSLVLLLLIPFSPSIQAQATQRAVVLVIDGPRNTEFIEDPGHGNIPHIWNDIAPHGVIHHEFFNNGVTSTVPGHAALASGVYQNLANDGSQRPYEPLFWEYFRDQTGSSEDSTVIAIRKSKLRVLSYSEFAEYGRPDSAVIVGPVGADSLVLDLFFDYAELHLPVISFICLAEIDVTAHGGDWDAYLDAISLVDSLAYELWIWIQGSPVFGDGGTAFIITADHGRHSYDFTQHGDACAGCRYIPFIAIGPDFLVGTEINDTTAEQIDLCPTLGYLLGTEAPYADGRILYEILTDPPAAPRPPVLQIFVEGDYPVLSWHPVDLDVHGAPITDVAYRVYRGDQEGFAADSNHLLAWGLLDTTYQDTLPRSLGDPSRNYSYAARAAQWETSVSDPSNTVGEFDYALP